MTQDNLPEIPLCACGCGGHAGRGRRFLQGHNIARLPDPPYRVDTETGCWNWLGRTDPEGYGHGWHREARRANRAHRIFYERAHGPIPIGLEIDHLCRNRSCVNPDHLEAVTAKVNVRRGRRTKLNEGAVRRIKQMLAQGLSRRQIAREFGVHYTNINQIASGKIWSDVTGQPMRTSTGVGKEKGRGGMTLAHGKTQTVYEMESISGRSASRLTGRKARRVDRPPGGLLRARRNWVTEGRPQALTAVSLTYVLLRHRLRKRRSAVFSQLKTTTTTTNVAKGAL